MDENSVNQTHDCLNTTKRVTQLFSPLTVSNNYVGPQPLRLPRSSLHIAAAVSALLFVLFVGIHFGQHIAKTHVKQGSSRDSHNAELLKAAEQGDTSQIRTLLEQGADQKDQALLLAAQQGKSEAIKLLLDSGANIEAHEINGDTAVTLAAAYPQTDALELLLDRGADVKDNNRETALMAVARDGNARSIALLLARVTFTPDERKEALFVAAESEPLVIELPASELPRRPSQAQSSSPAPATMTIKIRL